MEKSEGKGVSRRTLLKSAVGGTLTLAGCDVFNKEKKDDISYIPDICGVDVVINLTKEEVSFLNNNDSGMYVEIWDKEHKRELSWNILFYNQDTDSQPIDVDYGEEIVIEVYDIDALGYTWCETENVTLPLKSEFDQERNSRQQKEITIEPESAKLEAGQDEETIPLEKLPKHDDLPLKILNFHNRIKAIPEEAEREKAEELLEEILKTRGRIGKILNELADYLA